MSRKKSGHPHGHYCKVCGEYKANEKFSGKGHAAHICKVCSQLSAAEQAEAIAISCLMDLPVGRLSASDKAWLENRLHDHRPEVASIAQEVYKQHFPYAERNARKKQLTIKKLEFGIHTEVFNEYGDECPVNQYFTADRTSCVLTMTDYDRNGVKRSITLDHKRMSTLLRWIVHSLEIFMWPEDYGLTSPGLPPEYWLDELDEDDVDTEMTEVPEPEEKVSWQVQIEYSNHSTQDISSYRAYLPDRPEELYFVLLDYFREDIENMEEPL